ncbi:MAG: hypothetical protein JRH18_07585 [Deltaproteobacteria bacterium]|nr:hypothetical protein [Deltaproteobacteria bacterium]MBW1962188.1 hypothetical protein [Deltaproteobacteria bacterium]MBW2151513.1 hypothetical protein [Deltaproteobacteria bacterium]
MYNNEILCEKIRHVFPDIGECGIDLTVDYDEQKGAYVVDLRKDHHRLKTYLEPEDADICMQGKQCVGLGIQISQLRANIERMP